MRPPELPISRQSHGGWCAGGRPGAPPAFMSDLRPPLATRRIGEGARVLQSELLCRERVTRTSELLISQRICGERETRWSVGVKRRTRGAITTQTLRSRLSGLGIMTPRHPVISVKDTQ